MMILLKAVKSLKVCCGCLTISYTLFFIVELPNDSVLLSLDQSEVF